MKILENKSRYFLMDPTGGPPRMALAHSFWALQEREQLLLASLEQGIAAGFEFFEAGLREDRMTELRSLLERLPLKLIAQGWATTIGELEPFLQRAMCLKAVAFNLHLGHAFHTVDEAVALMEEAEAMTKRYGLPLLLETHRGRITQDLFRTYELSRRLPDVMFTLDASHYLVGGEIWGGSEKMFRKHLAPVLSHTGMIHGRISDGQSVQVPAGARMAATELLLELWTEAMRLWLAEAPAGAVLVFEPELGPPPYAFLTADGRETFSRHEETQVLVALAREAWQAAQSRPHSEVRA